MIGAVGAWLSVVRPAPATAQSFEGQTILSLEVNSRVGMTLEALSRLTGIHTGIPYSSRMIRQSLNSLYSTGLFTDVAVEVNPIEGGVAVVYQFTEKTFLSDLQIKGNRVFWTRTLKEAMGLQIGEEFTQERWRAAIANLLNFLQRKGYFRAKIDSDVSQTPGTNKAQVTVRVNEGTRAKIRETKFVGDTAYSNFQLWLKTIRSTGGEFYQADILEEDLARLQSFYHANGYLKSSVGPPEIQYKEATDEVTITVPIEAGTRLRVRFEGNGPFPDNQLTPLLLFEEEHSYDDQVFRASADRLEDFYRSKGFPFVKVDYTQRELPNEGTIEAVFEIDPGNFACLRTVLFFGNTFFTPLQLQNLIQTRPGNTLFCGTVVPDRLDSDAKILLAGYHEQGFQEIKVEPRVEYNEARTVAYLIFAIAEGPRTLITDIQFEGQQALAPAQLRKTIHLRPGQPYNEIPVRKDLEEILALYHKSGYVYARVDPELDFSKDRTQVGIRFRISENPQVRIGRIFLSGNTYTKDKVILRELDVKPGDPYDESRIQITRRRIIQLGYLGNVRFEPVTPLNPETKDTVKDMRLTVRENPTRTLDLGVGYADVEHLRGFAQWTHRNLWGTGQSLSLRAEGSSISRSASATYLEPWLLGYQLEGRLVGYEQTQERLSYTLTTTGATAGLGKNLTPTVKGSLQYQFDVDTYTNGVELLPEDQHTTIGSLTPALYWDTRDNPFSPTTGFINGVAFQDAATSLGSEVQFIKATVQSSWYYPLMRWMVVAVSARAGVSNRFGVTKTESTSGDSQSTGLLPPNERFFLGGRTSVRGYQQDELGIIPTRCHNGENCATIIPNDTNSGVDFSGGNAMLLFNGEIRIFLPGNLGLVIFNDRGNVFRLSSQVDINLIKSTIGAGLWYGTPAGPLRLDYGYKLNREKNLCPACPVVVKESPGEFHFTLGFAF
ncbi:MAG TPA: outer membrane protein assembly factor BamA [Nitrospiria bacterium]|nr:outer membrane protein assembly factor BamA [Nitrospiria bacterium]